MTMRAPYSQRESNDAALRAHGCTLFSTLYLRRWASGGDESPVAQNVIDREVWSLQADSGATKAQFLARGTTLDEAERAFEASRFTGRTKPRMRKYHGGNVRTDLLPELRAGKLALVCVNYGVIVSAGISVGSFPGGHAVVVGDPDKDSVGVADPLRTQVVRWDIDLLVKAMERFGSRPWLAGRGEFGVVAKSPTFLELARTQRDEARKDIAILRTKVKDLGDDLASSMEALIACEAKLPVTMPEALAAARAGGIADAAAAAKAVE